MKLVFVDTETGGLDPRKNPLLEVAAVVYCTVEDRIVDTYTAKLDPRYGQVGADTLDPKAMLVNQITFNLEWAEDSLEMAVMLGQFLRFLDPYADAQFAGHNVEFDLRFLRHHSERCGLTLPLSHRVVDTQSLSHPWQLAGAVSSTSLDEMCRHFGIPRSVRHRAMPDVLATLQLYRCVVRCALETTYFVDLPEPLAVPNEE